MPKITAATATDVATVDEKKVRYTPMPRSCWWARMARPRPSAMPTGTVRNANRNVVFTLSTNVSDVSTSRYWSNPT